MRKHIIIIALIHLFLGTMTGILFINGHFHFLSAGSMLFPESSVAADVSFLQKARDYFDVYMNFFGQFGINPLVSLLTIIISISFGYGLLKSKEWARKLGFIIIVVSAFTTGYSIFTGFVSLTDFIQLGLAAYMWWALTSAETKKMTQSEIV